MSLADYQLPTIQNLDSFRRQLNAILADIFAGFKAPYLSGGVATTNATVTTVLTVPVTTSVLVEARVLGVRTGGSSGAAGDSAGYVVRALAKNVAGTVTIIGQATTVVGESQAAWDAVAVVSGTDLLIRVTGAANNNITWTASGIKL